MVVQRITDVGYYYHLGEEELGPYAVDETSDPKFHTELAAKLGVEPKEILKAALAEIDRPTCLDEIAEILGSTIRQDKATKLILFCAMLLTFTEEDQINILLSSESAGGKSYNALEVVAYFPSNIVLLIATASPTAFFHDAGKWDKEANVLRLISGKRLSSFLISLTTH
jgi:hypothetical protein